MTEPILARARNIYEQQTHNKRMTWLLIIVFVLLITIIGVGFDVFLNIGSVARLIILPFVILMVATGIWNFKQRAAKGLWEKPKVFAETDDDNKFILKFILGLSFIYIFVNFFLGPLIHWYYVNEASVDRLFSQHRDIPLVRYLPIGTTLAVIIGIVSILISLYWGKNSILWSVNAKQLNKPDADQYELTNIIKEMSLAAGIPCPSTYIVKDSDPNAFTVGTSPAESSIVVTTGLLAMLKRDELQGVIAHEISHIRNSDTRLMTIITVLFGAVLLLSGWMKKSALLGGFSGSRVPVVGWTLRVVFFVGWILTLILAPLIACIVAMAVSRQREYLADAGGAELTRNPKALAIALMKIENAVEPTVSFHNGIAHLCVVDPSGKKINTKEGLVGRSPWHTSTVEESHSAAECNGV